MSYSTSEQTITITVQAPSAIPTGILFSSDKTVYTPQETINLSIQLFRTDTGAGLQGFSIQIILNGVLQKTVTTGSGGLVVTTLVAPLGSGQHTIKALFPGA